MSRGHGRRRLRHLEQLENRSLLATLAGSVFQDVNSDGTQDPGESAVPHWPVYLDLNNDGTHNAGPVTFAALDLVQPISDLQTTTTVVEVSGMLPTVSAVQVAIDLNHSDLSQLEAHLTGPNGARIQLFSNLGVGADLHDTVFDDAASELIRAGTAPYEGSFRPIESFSPFLGSDPNGTWTLEIFDGETGRIGTITAWELMLLEAPVEPLVETSVAGEYEFANVDAGSYNVRQQLPTGWRQSTPSNNAAHVVQVSQDETLAGLDFGAYFGDGDGSISGVFFDDANENGIQDQGEPGLAGGQVYLDLNNDGELDQSSALVESTDVPVEIEDRRLSTSTVDVGIQSATALRVHLDIEHTYVSDLRVSLVSPSGTAVRLIDQVGGSSDNFTGTILTDSATTGIANGSAPFTGEFAPSETLSQFMGEDLSGTWELQVRDFQNQDEGVLNSWSLEFETESGASELSTTTASDGSYSFSDLPDGDYRVVALPFNARRQTHPGADGTHLVSVDGGTNATGVDFGFAQADALLPDLVPVVDEDAGWLYGWYLDDTEIPGRTILRLSTAIANIGAGPLEIYGGAAAPDGETQEVYQRLYNVDGSHTDRLAGNFVYHESHGHLHFEGYGQYGVREITPDGGVGDYVALGDKTSFCLIDLAPFDLSMPGAPSSAGFGGCGNHQGVSVGWADIYGAGLPDQWVDVTEVPDGTYWLEEIIDPDNSLVEINEDNNEARIEITLERFDPTVADINVHSTRTDPVPRPDDGPAPTNWDTQRSSLEEISVSFSEPIQASIGDFRLVNLGVNADSDPDVEVALTADHLTIDGSRAHLRFDAGELADGVYELTIRDSVRDLAGNELASDDVVVSGSADNRLFQLNADLNGDAGVSIFDFPAIPHYFGRFVPEAPSYVDLNRDGGISIFDFARLAENFESTVQFPAIARDTFVPTPEFVGPIVSESVILNEPEIDRDSVDENTIKQRRLDDLLALIRAFEELG